MKKLNELLENVNRYRIEDTDMPYHFEYYGKVLELVEDNRLAPMSYIKARGKAKIKAFLENELKWYEVDRPMLESEVLNG